MSNRLTSPIPLSLPQMALILISWLLCFCSETYALSSIRRRDVLIGTAAAAATAVSTSSFPPVAIAATAAAAATTTTTTTTGAAPSVARSMETVNDPIPPLITLPHRSSSAIGNTAAAAAAAAIRMPRIGYSFYKTKSDVVPRCTALALRAGIRQLDIGYGSNAEVGQVLKPYIAKGLVTSNSGGGGCWDWSSEKPELLTLLDATAMEADAVAAASNKGPHFQPSKAQRREELFLHHRVSLSSIPHQSSQSNVYKLIRKSIQTTISELGTRYLDMVSIHSPIDHNKNNNDNSGNNNNNNNDKDMNHRLSCYAALLELRNEGLIRSVGVCNYGIGPLQEILNTAGNVGGLELPVMNQLEISPFHTHESLVSWCHQHDIVVGCSTWSKLSSTPSIESGWDVLAQLAKIKQCTKAQLLVRWALQKGYTSVPRSATTSKIERIAIAENSYGGVSKLFLTDEDMKTMDQLNVNLKAGTLGRRDGWDDEDVTGPDWDPTELA